MLAGRLGLTALFCSPFFLMPGPAQAADHLDAPLVQNDPQTDINDLYVFQAKNKNRSVFVLTVNPLAGMGGSLTFSDDAEYAFLLDVDGDAKEDVELILTFETPDEDGQQFYTLTAKGFVFQKRGVPLAYGVTGQTCRGVGGLRMTADVFDDPFFFDLAGFQDGLNFTGEDFFAGLNVTAIVLEIPDNLIQLLSIQPRSRGWGRFAFKLPKDTSVGVWATTTNDLGQIDRMGRPAINTVLIASQNKDAFNQGKPADDQADFRADVVATLQALGNAEQRANDLADILLPDILGYDLTDASGFLNGRQLADDVIDIELQLLTGNPAASDGVDANDVPFRKRFPYLAEPSALPTHAQPQPGPQADDIQ